MADEVNPMDILAGLVADPTESDTEEVVEGSPVEETTDVVGEAGEETVDEGEPEKLYAGKYKSAEELENAYTHAQQKMHEEAQKRAEYEKYIADMTAQQQAAAAEAQKQAFNTLPTNLQELVAFTYEEPEEAFWFASENAPQALDRVVGEIAAFDPQLAAKLQRDHANATAQQSVEMQRQQMEKLQQEVESAKFQAQLPYMQQQAATAVATAHQKIAALDNYDIVKEDMAAIIKERPYLINVESESTLALGLRDVYDLAVARNAQKIAAANQSRAANAGDGVVETGGFGGNEAVDEDQDAATQLKNSIFGVINKSVF